MSRKKIRGKNLSAVLFAKIMPKIKNIHSREILDSRGNPTVAVEVTLDNGLVGRAEVPSGASTGKFEAIELRDHDPKRYHGQGVLQACRNVTRVLAPALRGKDPSAQRALDQAMVALDGTPNKAKLGANATLGVSLAIARVAALAHNLELWQWIRNIFSQNEQSEKVAPLLQGKDLIPPISADLPRPCFNVINGGKHADNKLEFQEFWIIPVGAKTFSEAMRMGSEVFQTLLTLCKEKGFDTDVGNEGGFGPELDSNDQAMEIIIEAVKRAGYRLPDDFVLGLDVAASGFYENQQYIFKAEGLSLTADRLISLYNEWVNKYPLVVLEDGLAEEDWEAWTLLNNKLGEKILLVGDDLLVTNLQRFQKAITNKAANAILIKPNQIGTLTETLECIALAKQNGWRTIISHRSGDTCDAFIADLSVGTQAGLIKAGSLARSERLCKYNRLMEIEEKINTQ